jgi:hypothetical protein
MLVTKVRGQDKIDKVILSKTEVDLLRKMGVPLQVYAKEQLLKIAKNRRWKWYFNKEKQ